MPEQITVSVGGACPENQGPGGFAAIIQRGERTKISAAGGDPKTTGNRMELSAVIEALRLINEEPVNDTAEITIRTASSYVSNAFIKGWLDNWNSNGWKNRQGQPVRNDDLWKELQQEIGDREVEWELVEKPQNDPGITECDRQAKSKAQEAKTSKGYWTTSSSSTFPASRTEPETPPPAEPANPQPETPAAPSPPLSSEGNAGRNTVELALLQNREAAEGLRHALHLSDNQEYDEAQDVIQQAITLLGQQERNLAKAAEGIRAITNSPD